MLLDQVSSAALRADVPLCASASASAWWHSVSAYLHPTFDLTYVCMRIPAAGDTEVPKGNESEGGGIPGSATRKGLVSECVYYLTDEEVEYKVHAIQDIREQSHKHKLAVAMQSSEHRSSMSKSTAHAKRHSAHGAVSFEASMLEVVSKTTTAVTNTSASMDGWNTTISVSRAVAAFKKAGQGAHNSQVGPVAATLS